MKYLEFSTVSGNFLHRRHAIRLGRRYVFVAASVIFLGVLGYSKVNSIDDAVAQPLHLTEQKFPDIYDNH